MKVAAITLIIQLCQINMARDYASNVAIEQRKCQTELAACLLPLTNSLSLVTFEAEYQLLKCVAKRSAGK